MQATYASIYHWAAMRLALLAAVASVSAGATIAWLTVNQPANDAGDRSGNTLLATFAILGSCAASMACLYVGGKVVGAL